MLMSRVRPTKGGRARTAGVTSCRLQESQSHPDTEIPVGPNNRIDGGPDYGHQIRPPDDGVRHQYRRTSRGGSLARGQRAAGRREFYLNPVQHGFAKTPTATSAR
jgi:hypothetical protein